MKCRARALIESVALAFLVSCSSEIKKPQLMGEYRIHGSIVDDRVTLRQDGSYIHAVAITGRPDVVEYGHWELETLRPDGDLRITFYDFAFYVEHGLHSGRGLWPAFVSKRWGKIRLDVNEDLGLYYEKYENGR
jgi:hypothetical protein